MTEFKGGSEAVNALIRRFIDSGHKLSLDEDGQVQMHSGFSEIHSGPMCTVCYETTCIDCEPDYQPRPCPGEEAMKKVAKEARREQWEKLSLEFGPVSIKNELDLLQQVASAFASLAEDASNSGIEELNDNFNQGGAGYEASKRVRARISELVKSTTIR